MSPFKIMYQIGLSIYTGLHRRWLLSRDPVDYARSLGVQIGERCRLLGVDEVTFGSEPYLVTLGHHVTVTGGVRFVTHDGGVWIFRQEHPQVDAVAPIHVGDNVFLGFNVIVLPGITIGDNCVIGAGSVVTRDIPPNSVAAGVPARVLKTKDEYWRDLQHKLTETAQLNYAEKRQTLQHLYSS